MAWLASVLGGSGEAAAAGGAAGGAGAAGAGLGSTLGSIGSGIGAGAQSALGTFGTGALPAGIAGPTVPASGLLGGLSGQAGLGTAGGLGGSGLMGGAGSLLGQYLNTRAGGFPGLASTALGAGGQPGLGSMGLDSMLSSFPTLQAAVKALKGAPEDARPKGLLSGGIASGLLSGHH